MNKEFCDILPGDEIALFFRHQNRGRGNGYGKFSNGMKYMVCEIIETHAGTIEICVVNGKGETHWFNEYDILSEQELREQKLREILNIY
jgi:hypothetical protein